jgi:hypothetical protein
MQRGKIQSNAIITSLSKYGFSRKTPPGPLSLAFRGLEDSDGAISFLNKVFNTRVDHQTPAYPGPIPKPSPNQPSLIPSHSGVYPPAPIFHYLTWITHGSIPDHSALLFRDDGDPGDSTTSNMQTT